MPNPLSHDDYTVGWICALPLELAAAQAVLDETHEPLPSKEGDYNVYAYGRISEHNVVMACLPAGLIGTNSAASVAMQMQRSFRCLRFGLMVGIGGGVPSKEHDIRLGDVVVAQPGNGYGGVVQYDFGKSRPDGFERTGFLNAPPTVLLSAVSMIRAKQRADGGTASHILDIPATEVACPSPSDTDVLHSATSNDAVSRVVDRPPRSNPGVHVHYGTMASGNQVMRDATQRDRVSKDLGGVLCFEMEAAGLMNSFPCLVIRGICDYSDAHKTKDWQSFAAATAAVYTKQLLTVLPKAALLNDKSLQDDRIVSLPFQRNHKFVGRQDVLRELERRLFLDEECQEIALFGLGGIGKTQVVLEFANMVSETNPDITVLWVVSLSQATIEKSFQEIAAQLKLPLSSGGKEDVKDAVKRHLEHVYSRRWLLVIDNVDDEKLIDFLLGCVPHSKTGYNLYTSRSTRVVQDLVGGDAIEIQPLDAEEGLRLMKTSLLKYNSGHHESDITALCEELEFLPLALTQAAAYMNQNLVTPAKYRTLMTGADQDLVQVMSVENRDRTRYQQVGHAVATTWVVSFNQILQNYPMAADILKFISCVEWRAIPLSMLPQNGTAVEVASAVGILCAYSFIVPSAVEDTYDMHRLVHLATRVWVSERGDTGILHSNTLMHMKNILPTKLESRDVWRALLPHATCLLRLCGEIEPDAQAKLCYSVAWCLDLNARHKESIQWLEKSLQLLMGLNAKATTILAVQEELAEAYWHDNQVSWATELLERIVAHYRSNVPEHDACYLKAESRLAMMYTASGRAGEAVSMLERVLAIQQSGPAESQDTLFSARRLGKAYRAQGQIQKSIDLLEYVEEQQRHLAETDMELILTRQDLSRAYMDDGSPERATKAMQLLEHINSTVAVILQIDHIARLSIQQDLATAHLRQRNPGSTLKAIRLLENVVEIMSTNRAQGDPWLLDSQRALVKAYFDFKPEHHAFKLVQLLEHIVQIDSQSLEEDDPSRLWTQCDLGQAHLLVGDKDSVRIAVKTLERATQIGSAVFEKHNPSLLSSRIVLARAYIKLDGRDNLARAMSLLEDVVHIESHIHQEHDPYRVWTEHELAKGYLSLKQPDATSKAVNLLEHVTRIQGKVLKEDDPSRLSSQHLLARAYLRMNKPSASSKGIELLEHVTSIQSQTIAAGDPSRLHAQYDLAQAYLKIPRLRATSVAIELLEHIVEVDANTLDEDDSARSASRDLLQEAYSMRQRMRQTTDSERLEQATGIKRQARGWRLSTIRKLFKRDGRTA